MALDPLTVPFPSQPPRGQIYFGTDVNVYSRLGGQKIAFGPRATVEWLARFTHPVARGRGTIPNAVIYLSVYRLSACRGRQVYATHRLTDSASAIGWSEVVGPANRAAYGMGRPGTYLVRYSQGNTILAQGEFTWRK